MPPFETFTISTRRNRTDTKAEKMNPVPTMAKYSEEFATEVAEVYEDVASRKGKVVAHYVLELSTGSHGDVPHAVIVAELPEVTPADD